MNPNISTSFFSREALLQRQARTLRSRKLTQSSIRNKPLLNVILEEDETRTSSRSPSPVLSLSSSSKSGSSSTHSLKAKRRRAMAHVSDIRIARESTHDDDIELSPLLLSAPRPAPSPPTSSSESPDSFSLTFTNVAYKFPHPPTPSSLGGCESPTPSMSSLSSSPCSRHGDMPLTPSSSDDESSTSSRSFNPRRAAIQPLVIAKHNPRPSSPFNEISLSSSSLLEPFKDSSEEPQVTSLTSAFMDDVYSYDSDPESDSEWYNREFSDFLSLYSPTPSSFPIQQARPESMFLSEDIDVASPKSQRRISKALPPTPSTPASRRESVVVPSAEPKRSSKRESRRISIPKYPPPPVPTASRPSSMSSRTSSPTSAPACNKTLPHSIRRPPPRMSIPLDCELDFDLAEIEEDDSSSAFSFSMYEIDLDYGIAEQPKSSGSSGSDPSVYSQPSFEEEEDHFDGQEITFDLDYSLMLPLSLPTTPFDLEADIALGLEKLRVQEETQVDLPTISIEEQQPAPTPEPTPEPEQEIVVDDVFSPSSSSSFSFSPSPSVTSHSNDYFLAVPSSNTAKRPLFNEEKILKSKWSSSTLGSVREEHEHRASASKLRLYFGGGQSPSKSGKRGSAQSNKKVPPTPTSPFSLMTPRKSSRGYAVSPPPSASPSSRGHFRGTSSDVMIIGYGGGVRRRGSVSTVSDVGSEDSSSSTSSSGLRRKPIPIEMFLRSDMLMKSTA
ncbi:hypothetical protein JR316_0009585 [Psilocybe cubensis]|uniref:Uncharacterized protein n=2 Tax=Psilocybe cubensis TaxID=181762 RepID=A0ACB8GPP3_PSICU|nr:hypothetical protein JR316_0009585 [Psilocybe cubensis]KAH9477377.1 hypothetical protein JR316_0009585 [Psilocybe cubensis]